MHLLSRTEGPPVEPSCLLNEAPGIMNELSHLQEQNTCEYLILIGSLLRKSSANRCRLIWGFGFLWNIRSINFVYDSTVNSVGDWLGKKNKELCYWEIEMMNMHRLFCTVIGIVNIFNNTNTITITTTNHYYFCHYCCCYYYQISLILSFRYN